MSTEPNTTLATAGSLSLKWQCCGCKRLNQPSEPRCLRCDKQRWEQLGLSERIADKLARRILEAGYDKT